jgi:phosphoribosylformylglycinamidine synthase
MQALRDNPDCAREEYDRLIEPNDPGPPMILTFEENISITSKTSTAGGHPSRAGRQRAGGDGGGLRSRRFESVDVHVTDLIAGRVKLAGFKGFSAGGGFSYGDVLGGGRGWASTILYNDRARAEFEAFFARKDTFLLGACNGCQMMGQLKELVPGAEHWPVFVRNRSEQFEARMVMVEITESPSILFRGMAGSRIPVVTAHGEGRAFFEKDDQKRAIVAMRYVTTVARSRAIIRSTRRARRRGVTGVTTADGRFTIVCRARLPNPADRGPTRPRRGFALDAAFLRGSG